MSFAQDNGYTPLTVEEIFDFIREKVNEQFNTSYTPETFVGTNWYKYAYGIVQRIQSNEIKTSEIFAKLQEYIATTNEKIQRPSVSHPGLIDSFESRGYEVSVKPPSEEDRGLISICVNVDQLDPDYPAIKREICTLIKDFVAAGIVSTGTEVESITLSNGQSFDFKYHLPTKKPILLRLTCLKSKNTLLTIPGDEEIRQIVFDNINSRYRLGWNFEPQRYFTLSDALWASQVTLEYSLDNGESWSTDVYEADFKDLLTFGLEDIEVIIDDGDSAL